MAPGEGYAVYENGITNSTQVASIGFSGEEGLRQAIDEANRRFAQLAN